MKKYNLTITREQADVLSSACELLARVHMGQLGFVAESFLGKESAPFIALREALEEIEPLATEMHRNAYHSISSKEIPDEARVAWDIYQVIRNRTSHDRADEKGTPKDFLHRGTRCYDTPMRFSEEQELPEMRDANESS